MVKILKLVYDLEHGIKIFFGGKLKILREFKDQHWLCDFAFLVDMSGYLHEVNQRLQGKDQLINKMYEHVLHFK